METQKGKPYSVEETVAVCRLYEEYLKLRDVSKSDRCLEVGMWKRIYAQYCTLVPGSNKTMQSIRKRLWSNSKCKEGSALLRDARMIRDHLSNVGIRPCADAQPVKKKYLSTFVKGSICDLLEIAEFYEKYGADAPHPVDVETPPEECKPCPLCRKRSRSDSLEECFEIVLDNI